ncbi:hypothetical protein H5410_021782 [Solanum commersonii]|uniref:Uncharacterized protein n=1 Tax=Solanum commersonii TaxID=4109 RepID=A0A9J5ZDH9_SOLCO|nr:hypothetical protein H5410_021782 [Solanum commersonii]
MSFQRLAKFNSVICMIPFLVLFSPICSVLRLTLNESNLWTHQHPYLKLLLVLKQTEVQSLKKGASNSATQD